MNTYRRVIFSLTLGLGLLLAWCWQSGGVPNPIRAASGALFVTPDGTGNCSQDDACDLPAALAQAVAGDTIYLAQGTYTGTGDAVLVLTHDLLLAGGWDGAPSGPVIRDPELYPTTLDGEDARRVVYVSGAGNVTLEGLTLANGRTLSTTLPSWNGAGLYALDANLILRHSHFHNNLVDVYDYDAVDSYAYGGGAYVEGGTAQLYATTFRGNSAWARRSAGGGGAAFVEALSVTVEESTFWDNDAWHASGLYLRGVSLHTCFVLQASTFVGNGWGRSPGNASGGYTGALEISKARARVEENAFSGNRASNDYGAVSVFFSELAFSRNIIRGNHCSKTSALYLSGVSPLTLTNNIIADNVSTYYWLDSPAVRLRDSHGAFLHNTIARNESTYGLHVDSGSEVALTNTLLVSHTVGLTVTAGSSATLTATLWGSGAWANGTDWGGAGVIVTGTLNLWGDPAFVAPGAGDYHLAPGSAAVDGGIDAGVREDIDGDSRPAGNGYDIGADEVWWWRIYLPVLLRHAGDWRGSR